MGDAVAAEQLHEFLEKQAIREVAMRYCRGVDRCDAALISSAYHPDAFDDHSGRIFTGETVGEGIVASMREILDATTHHITTQTIKFDGDTARCESYYVGVHLETVTESDDGCRPPGVTSIGSRDATATEDQ